MKMRKTLAQTSILLTLCLQQAEAVTDCHQFFHRFAQESESKIKTALKNTRDQALLLLGGPSIPRPKHKDTDSWLRSLVEQVQHYSVPVGKAFSPIPLRKTWGRGETYAIFRKVWKNPDAILSAQESAILKARQMQSDLEEFRLLVRENPRSVKTSKILETTVNTAIVAGTTAGVVHLVNQAEGGMVSSHDFLNDTKFRLGTWQAQLIAETVPFPHLAIRVGEKVYSYGQTHMTVTSVVEYLEEKKFADLYRKMNPAENTTDPQEHSRSGRSLSKALLEIGDSTGLSNLPRSVQIVTLNLAPDSYKNLKSYLEDQTGKRYENITFVNDCATMVVRALEKTTPLRFSQLVDASPSQVVMSLSLLHATGSELVGRILQVTMEKQDQPWTHLLRNFYINSIENKVFATSFLINQGWRSWIEATRSESDLQSHDDEVKEVIEKRWREETEEFMRAHRQLQPVIDALEQFENTAASNPEKNQEALRVQSLLDYAARALEKRESSKAESKLESFQTKTLARYRLEWLEAERARIQKVIQPFLNNRN